MSFGCAKFRKELFHASWAKRGEDGVEGGKDLLTIHVTPFLVTGKR